MKVNQFPGKAVRAWSFGLWSVPQAPAKSPVLKVNSIPIIMEPVASFSSPSVNTRHDKVCLLHLA